MDSKKEVSGHGHPGSCSDSVDAEHKPVPVVIITGYLGAGKTTLLRNILKQQHGVRVAVIMNELGEGLDDAALTLGKADHAEMWISLPNGCMCCKLKADFVLAIESLFQQDKPAVDFILVELSGVAKEELWFIGIHEECATRPFWLAVPVLRIMQDAMGAIAYTVLCLATPGPVASLLCAEADTGARYQLDSIVTVVDCLNLNRQLHDSRPEGVLNEAQSQIAYADMIVLNKMDLSDEEAHIRSEADIRAINTSVPILHAKRCNVELSHLLHRKPALEALHVIAESGEEEEEGSGLPSRSASQTVTPALDGLGDSSGSAPTTPWKAGPEEEGELRKEPSGNWMGDDGIPCSGSRGLRPSLSSRSRSVSRSRRRSLSMDDRLSEGAAHALHDPDISSVTVSSSKPLDLTRLKAFMDKLLWNRDVHPDDIHRVKGVVQISGSDKKHVVQAVYEAYEIAPTEVAWTSSEQQESKVVTIGRCLKPGVIAEWFAECEA